MEYSGFVQYKVLCMEGGKKKTTLFSSLVLWGCYVYLTKAKHDAAYVKQQSPAFIQGWWIYGEVMDCKVTQGVGVEPQSWVLLTPVLYVIVRPYGFVFANDCSK